MSGFNYNKWDKIELSDDESDLHPNIDKDSWFRMKHRARLEREEKEDIEVKNFEQLNLADNTRIRIIQARLNGLHSENPDEDAEFEDVDALKGELKELQDKISKRNKRILEIKERRLWNIDNICKTAEEKSDVTSKTSSTSLKAEDFVPTGETAAALAQSEDNKFKKNEVSENPKSKIVESSKPSSTVVPTKNVNGPSEGPTNTKSSNVREKFAVLSYNDYVLKHEATLEKYSEIRDIENSKEFLFKNCDVLLHEHAQSYMLLSSLEDEMNGKKDRMKLVCRQSQILSHITELATSLRRDPRDVILPFFKRIDEKEYFNGFIGAVNDFIERIKKRAIDKRKEMDLERSQEAGSAPLGPGGLDPYEVLEALPEVLRTAFESQSVEKLQEVLASMDPIEAKKWMKMCVDSGLWCPSDKSVFEDQDEEA